MVGEVVDSAVKERSLRTWAAELGVALEDVIAVGDGANDIDMVTAAGLGVAYNGKPALRAAADAQINRPNRDAVRFFADL